jgi:folate-binding protein YgfZ
MTEATAGRMKSLPLENLHRADGARLMPVCGWLLPSMFSDPEAEYRAARESVALFDASFLTKVTASGADHLEYLNRRLSQRVIEMAVGEGLHATQLNAEGRMEAELELFRTGEAESLLVAPPAVGGEYLQLLADKYVFSEDAKFADATSAWAAFGIVGPRAEALLEQSGVSPLDPNRAIVSIPLPGGGAGYLLRTRFLNHGYALLLPVAAAEAIWRKLQEVVEKSGGRRLGFLAFDTIRVEAGIPWWGIDLNERSIPLEADLMSAVHTNKGCYPGQETIAKILNLGHPARKLVGIVWDREDPPAADSALLVDGKEAGRLSSSTYSPVLQKAIGLAMVRWPHRNVGTEMTEAGGSRGTVVSLPFPHTQAG